MSSPGEAFAVSIDASGVHTAAVVRLTGELDMATAPELEACLLALEGKDIIVDMARLTFMDSSGIRVLLIAFKRPAAADQTLVLRSPSAQVARTLRMSGVDEVLTIESTD